MNVKIYSTPTCPYCVKAKDYFTSLNIEYEDYDVSKDRSKAKEMIEKSGQRGVPVIDIDGNVIIGFDRVKIDELVK